MGASFAFILSDYAGYGLVTGFLMVAFGFDRLYVIPRVLGKGQKTLGTVIEIRQDPGGLNSGLSKGDAPVVEYTSHNGNVYKYYSMTFRKPGTYAIGDKVDIWYKHYKSRRYAALQDDESERWPVLLIYIGVGLLFISFYFSFSKLQRLIGDN